MTDVSNVVIGDIAVAEATDNAIQLMDFPNEVLLRMFHHFSDTHLLDMTRVCTRFEAIASETFAKRYNGASDDKYFKIVCISNGDEPVFLPIFEAFGKSMTAMEIAMDSMVEFSQDYWLYRFIRDYCTSASITHVIIRDANYSFDYQQFLDSLPAITHLTFVDPHKNEWAIYRYEHVTNFRAKCFFRIDTSAVHQFVENNPQLQHLDFNGIFMRNPLNELSGKLNRLESLVLNRIYVESIDLTEVVFEQLKSLTMSLGNTSAANVVRAIQRGCKHIESLDIKIYDDGNQRLEEQDGDLGAFLERQKAERTCYYSKFFQIIGTFDQLTSLRFKGYDFEWRFLEILWEKLPKLLIVLRLVFPRLEDQSFDCDDLLQIFIFLKSLEILSISVLEEQYHGYWFFGLEWCQHFAEIAEQREHAIRCEYTDPKTNVIATKDKCIINGGLEYWVGYEPERSQSKMHILDLNERCIEKILEWVPEDKVTGVYQACTAFKKALGKRVQSQWHHHSSDDISNFICWLGAIGDDIRKLVIWVEDNNAEDDNDTIEILELVRDRCSKIVTEFKINIAKTSLMDDLNLSFPSLEKLTIVKAVTANGKVMPTMHCPKLKYLDIGWYEINADEEDVEPAVQDFHLGLSIDNLTVLKLQHFDDVIANLFSRLSDKICDQLLEFTVAAVDDPVTDYGNRVVSMASRFRNLQELNLVFPGIECINTVFLFERCTKLVKLSLGYGQYHYDEKMQRLLKNCKKHCNALKVIQLVYRDAALTADEKIFEFISDEFPDVQLYKVGEVGEKCEITLWKKGSTSKECDKPY